jgi:hypothetical protein
MADHQQLSDANPGGSIAMFVFYLKILGVNLGITNFVLLMAAFLRNGAFSSSDFALLNAIHFLTVTLIFISLDLFSVERNGPTGDRAGRVAVKQNTGGFKSSALQLSDKE